MYFHFLALDVGHFNVGSGPELSCNMTLGRALKEELKTDKIDSVGPVDNRASTYKLHQIVRKKEEKKYCDMWHMRCDTWHVTHDMWHVTCWGGWTFSQNFSSLAFTVFDLWYYDDIEEKAHLLTEWMNQSQGFL